MIEWKTRMFDRSLLILIFAVSGGITAGAQVTEAQRTALDRVALGKARSQLHAAICRLPLKGELTVGTWAGRQPALDRALRTAIRSQTRQSAARIYSDGACDLDLRLTPDELARQLIALREKHTPPSGPASASDVSAAEITAAARNWPTLTVTGSAEVAEQDAA